VNDEAFAEIRRHVLEQGVPVKDELVKGEDWRDYDWDHSGNGCPGWSETGQSELDIVPFEGGVVFTVTHCRCACRVHPHVTVGLEGTLAAG
jgi:hypothetical protein